MSLDGNILNTDVIDWSGVSLLEAKGIMGKALYYALDRATAEAANPPVDPVAAFNSGLRP